MDLRDRLRFANDVVELMVPGISELLVDSFVQPQPFWLHSFKQIPENVKPFIEDVETPSLSLTPTRLSGRTIPASTKTALPAGSPV